MRKATVMLLQEHFVSTGQNLFKRRSFVLLAFLPFMAYALTRGEPVEAFIGEVGGEAFEMAALALIVGGLLIRILTVGFAPAGTSGRNTHAQVAKQLNTTGFYSVTRNPLYLGNCMMYLGLVLTTQSLWLSVVMLLVLIIYYERIIAAEEAFLTEEFGTSYADWSAKTPAFLPRLNGWVPPALPFCWRTTLRREHPGIAGAILMLFVIELGQVYLGGDATHVEPVWYVLAALGLLLLVGTRLTVLRTRWLHRPGR